MTDTVTIQGELRLPAVFLQGIDMDEVERRLRAYALLPMQARERRWRMDTDVPGGYILTYTFTLPVAGE